MVGGLSHMSWLARACCGIRHSYQHMLISSRLCCRWCCLHDRIDHHMERHGVDAQRGTSWWCALRRYNTAYISWLPHHVRSTRAIWSQSRLRPLLHPPYLHPPHIHTCIRRGAHRSIYIGHTGLLQSDCGDGWKLRGEYHTTEWIDRTR